MDDVVLVAVLQRTPDLAGKLSRDPLTETTMADDVVQHLTSTDILENHVVVMLMHDHLSHATNVRVVEEHA